MRLFPLSFLLFLFLLSPNKIHAECEQLPYHIINIPLPSSEFADTLQWFERDSLQFITDVDCQLLFYAHYVYVLRRIEAYDEAYSIVDRVINSYNLADYPFRRSQLFLELATLEDHKGALDRREPILDSLQNWFERYNYYNGFEVSENDILGNITVSIGLFNDAQRLDFVNQLLEKQLELSGEGNVLFYCANYLMRAVINYNNNAYGVANENITKVINKDCWDEQSKAEADVIYGSVLVKLDSFEKSSIYLNKVLDNELLQSFIKAYALVAIAEVYEQQDYQDSLSMITRQLKVLVDDENIDLGVRADMLHYLMSENVRQSEMSEFFEHGQIFEEIIDTTDSYYHLRYYEYLVKDAVFRKFSDDERKNFLYYQRMSKRTENQDDIADINNIELRYKNKQKETENLLLKKEKELQAATLQRQRFIIFGSILGLLLLGIIGALFYRQSEDRKRNNQILSDKNAKIELLHEELNHRIKNNLNFIVGMMRMQKRRMRDDIAKEAIGDSEIRIEAMSLVYKKLYNVQNEQRLNLKAYITELCENLAKTYPKNEVPQAKFSINFFDIIVTGDTAMRIGLMVNELVTNSIKYAFLNQTNPNINIEFNKLKTGSFRLSYNDNGCGLPEKINPKKSTTLGLKLIQLLTKQLNGTMDTENRNGAFFYFYFEALK